MFESAHVVEHQRSRVPHARLRGRKARVVSKRQGPERAVDAREHFTRRGAVPLSRAQDLDGARQREPAARVARDRAPGRGKLAVSDEIVVAPAIGIRRDERDRGRTQIRRVARLIRARRLACDRPERGDER